MILRLFIIVIACIGHRQCLGADNNWASMVRWSGGEVSLQEMIDLVSRNDNTTRLEPGTNAEQKAFIPPVNITYWQAVLMLCSVYDLRIVPPSAHRSLPNRQRETNEEAILETGAVVLAETIDKRVKKLPKSPTAQQLADWLTGKNRAKKQTQFKEPAHRFAAGPYLIECVDAAVATKMTFASSISHCGIAVRFRLEPKWLLKNIESSTITWTKAITGNGIDLQIAGRPQTQNRNHFMQRDPNVQVTRSRLAPNVALMLDVPANLKTVQLTGIVDTAIARDIRDHLTLTPGAERELHFNGSPLTVSLLTKEQAIDRGFVRTGLLLQTTADHDTLPHVQVSTMSGTKLGSHGVIDSEIDGVFTRYLPYENLQKIIYNIDLIDSNRTHNIRQVCTIPIRLP